MSKLNTMLIYVGWRKSDGSRDYSIDFKSWPAWLALGGAVATIAVVNTIWH